MALAQRPERILGSISGVFGALLTAKGPTGIASENRPARCSFHADDSTRQDLPRQRTGSFRHRQNLLIREFTVIFFNALRFLLTFR